MPIFLLVIAVSLVSLGFLWAAMRSAHRRRLMDNLPTCKTTGIFIGLVEVKGTAESERPLVSYLAGKGCVYFSWSVEEHWSRTVVEHYTDSQGRSQTRIRHESGWTTVADGADGGPFYLQDDHGVVLVRPDGATIEATEVFDTECGRGDPLYFEKGPDGSVANSDHRRRFREWVIPLHGDIYVIGKARERADIVAPEIAKDGEAPLFLISTRPEEQIVRGKQWSVRIYLVLGLILGAGGIGVAMIQTGAMPPDLPWLPFVIGAAAYLFLATFGWTWMAFNSLVDLRERVASAWSLVDIQLKRRFDLVPSLEAMVKGASHYEKETQEILAKLRSQRQPTAPGEPGPDPESLSGMVVVLAERYPELTSQGAFLKLQHQLSDTEQRIALARGYYNDIASHYNTQIERFPDRLLRGFRGFERRGLMGADEFERPPVLVHLVE